MTQKSIKIFIDEIYSRRPKNNYSTTKTDVYHVDYNWSLDIQDRKHYGPENNRGYRYVLVITDNFPKIGWTLPLKKTAQIIREVFENILKSSERRPNLMEVIRKELYNSIFQNFLNNKNNKQETSNTSIVAVFAERFNRTIRDILKRPVFERGDSNWIDVLVTITKQYNGRVHTSSKLTPIQASLKKTKGFVYQNLLDKRKKMEPKFQVNDLVRTADSKKNVFEVRYD